MEPDDGGAAATREVRVQGFGLFVLGGALAALVGGAFYLGYQVGRSGSSDSTPASAELPTDRSDDRVASPTPASRAFDTVPERGSAAEPERQAVRPPGGGATGNSPKTAPTPGPWVVQVFAGRDRHAAESVVASLNALGYPVQLDSRSEDRDALFRVRVGGYPDEGAARAAADRLKKDGHSGAWVTRAR